jgi:quercetin dioxygenase-like cupin family protein
MPFRPIIKLVHEDSRGEMYSISLPDGQELMLLHSNPGSFRGGHSHNGAEVAMILSGKMLHRKRIEPIEAGEPVEEISVLVAGDICCNPVGQVHMGEFLEDTWLVEAKSGPENGGWITTDYEPYRQRVWESLA